MLAHACRGSAAVSRATTSSRQAQLVCLRPPGRATVTTRADPTGDAGAATPAEAPGVPSAGPAKTGSSRGPAAFNDSVPETLFYEGSASNAELIISLLLGATLVYLPITIAIIGKKLWFTYKFTNKRVVITNKAPLFAREVQVSYKDISEVRTAPRAFGLWGDCVIFLKNGDRLEITGLENFQDIKRHILSCIYD